MKRFREIDYKTPNNVVPVVDLIHNAYQYGDKFLISKGIEDEERFLKTPSGSSIIDNIERYTRRSFNSVSISYESLFSHFLFRSIMQKVNYAITYTRTTYYVKGNTIFTIDSYGNIEFLVRPAITVDESFVRYLYEGSTIQMFQEGKSFNPNLVHLTPNIYTHSSDLIDLERSKGNPVTNITAYFHKVVFKRPLYLIINPKVYEDKEYRALRNLLTDRIIPIFTNPNEAYSLNNYIIMNRKFDEQIFKEEFLAPIPNSIKSLGDLKRFEDDLKKEIVPVSKDYLTLDQKLESLGYRVSQEGIRIEEEETIVGGENFPDLMPEISAIDQEFGTLGDINIEIIDDIENPAAAIEIIDDLSVTFAGMNFSQRTFSNAAETGDINVSTNSTTITSSLTDAEAQELFDNLNREMGGTDGE